MIIRKAIEKDLEEISDLAQKVYIETFGTTMSAEELESAIKGRNLDYFKKIFNRDIICIALEDTKIIGFIQFGKVDLDIPGNKENSVELNKLFIDKNYQGKGIGKQLIESMLKDPYLIGKKYIYLDVYDKNISAIGLYRKYGFNIVGKVAYKPSDKIIGYDLLMRKDL